MINCAAKFFGTGIAPNVAPTLCGRLCICPIHVRLFEHSVFEGQLYSSISPASPSGFGNLIGCTRTQCKDRNGRYQKFFHLPLANHKVGNNYSVFPKTGHVLWVLGPKIWVAFGFGSVIWFGQILP